MSSEDNALTDFLDDYFAESEEHLGSLRCHLLVVERFVNRNHIDPGVVDELLRALHSLKGLSAMAGVHKAEQVAHAMEDSLRDMKQTCKGPTESAMEALASGTAVIEQVISARREQKPGPETTSILSRLTAVVAHRGRFWRFQFSPTTELSSRGINVNSIRSRLQKIGQVMNATPHIVESDQVTFDLIIDSNID
jgi:two-component system chemotaxis sensor kinase CheA